MVLQVLQQQGPASINEQYVNTEDVVVVLRNSERLALEVYLSTLLLPRLPQIPLPSPAYLFSSTSTYKHIFTAPAQRRREGDRPHLRMEPRVGSVSLANCERYCIQGFSTMLGQRFGRQGIRRWREIGRTHEQKRSVQTCAQFCYLRSRTPSEIGTMSTTARRASEEGLMQVREEAPR